MELMIDNRNQSIAQRLPKLVIALSIQVPHVDNKFDQMHSPITTEVYHPMDLYSYVMPTMRRGDVKWFEMALETPK